MKLKFEFEVEIDEEKTTQSDVKRFMDNARKELSVLAYGNPCPLIDELFCLNALKTQKLKP